MRLLRVDYAESPTSLDLHPLITVIDGLSDGQRAELIGLVRRIAAGSTTGIRGLIHHQSELVELDGRGGRPELVPTDIDPIMFGERRSDVMAEGYKRALISSAQVEEIRSQLATELEAEVLELRRQLRLAIDVTGSENASAQGVGQADLVEPQIAPVVVDGRTYNGVGEAFVVVQRTPRTVRNRIPEVEELQQRWSQFEARQVQSEQHASRLSDDLAAASSDVAVAEASLRAAEESARPVLLTPRQEQRVEELAEKAQSDSKRWRRSGQLTEAEEREFNSLLAVVGVQSWTEYSVFRLAPTITDDKQAALDQAKHHFTEAEARLNTAQLAVSEDSIIAQLDAEKASIRQAAVPYLGAVMPDDLGHALLAFGQDEINPDWAGAVTELCRVLDQAHLEPVLSPTGTESAQGEFEQTADQILEWTRDWLASQEQAMAQTELSGSSDEHAVGSTEDLGTTSAPVIPDDYTLKLRSALSEAELRLADHRRALDQIADAEAQFHDDVLATAELDADDSGRDSPPAVAADRVATMIEEMSSGEGRESLPLLVDLNHDPATTGNAVSELMNRCLELSDRFQIIVLARQPEAHDWAELAGTEAAFSVGRAASPV